MSKPEEQMKAGDAVFGADTVFDALGPGYAPNTSCPTLAEMPFGVFLHLVVTGCPTRSVRRSAGLLVGCSVTSGLSDPSCSQHIYRFVSNVLNQGPLLALISHFVSNTLLSQNQFLAEL